MKPSKLIFELSVILCGFGIYESIYSEWSSVIIALNEGEFTLIRAIIVLVLLVLFVAYYVCSAYEGTRGAVALGANGEKKLKVTGWISAAGIVAISFTCMGPRQAFCFIIAMLLVVFAMAIADLENKNPEALKLHEDRS